MHTTARSTNRLDRVAAALLTIGAGCLVGSLEATAPLPPMEPLDLDPARVPWTHLGFEASKLGLTSTSELRLVSLPASAAADDLARLGNGAGLLPSRRGGLLLTLDTTLLSRHSRVSLWLDPADARAFQRVQLETGGKARHYRHKTYRFAADGVFSLSRKPADGELELPHERWSEVEDDYQPYAPQALGLTVIEPSAFFYVVAASRLAASGDRLKVATFSKGDVHPVELEVEAVELLEVDYLERSPRGERRVEGQLPALRVAIRTRADDDEVKLLGLKGDLELFLDPTTRLPLEVRGKLPVVGRVRVRLYEAEVL